MHFISLSLRLYRRHWRWSFWGNLHVPSDPQMTRSVFVSCHTAVNSISAGRSIDDIERGCDKPVVKYSFVPGPREWQ